MPNVLIASAEPDLASGTTRGVRSIPARLGNQRRAHDSAPWQTCDSINAVNSGAVRNSRHLPEMQRSTLVRIRSRTSRDDSSFSAAQQVPAILRVLRRQDIDDPRPLLLGQLAFAEHRYELRHHHRRPQFPD